MFKLLLVILIILMIVGGENVFSFSTNGDLWILQINYQKLLNSPYNGFNIIVDFVNQFISEPQPTVSNTQA